MNIVHLVRTNGLRLIGLSFCIMLSDGGLTACTWLCVSALSSHIRRVFYPISIGSLQFNWQMIKLLMLGYVQNNRV